MTTTPPANSDQTDAPAPLAKAYRPTETEPAVWSKWLDANAFHADPDRVISGDAPPYSILIPPPNVTAALHLGHALNNTIQDILIRAHRMKGFETLWMPGTDHAGIATQTMVDKRLREAGEPALAEHRKLEAEGHNGREKFTAKVQAFKDEFETRITDQLKAMGCSCDYERQRFTMDEVCARAVREAFFRLFKDGLIERGKRLVNWDPVTQTALADDEVEMEEVEGSFWYLRYPLVDDQGNETDEYVTVATTRPETYFGDTGVAVNPSDPKHAKLIGRKVKLPFVGRIIPIVGDDYVVMADPESSDSKAKYASGFLKVTPAHDPNDWLIGQRHNLDVINIMAPDASISDQHGWEDVGDAQRFVGLSREDARTAVESAFRDADLLEAKKPYSHSVGHSYRSHAAIEPYLSDQWYCRVTDDKLRGNAQRAVVADQRTDKSIAEWPASKPDAEQGDGRMTFHPARYAKTYETWHDNLRDWCISRQLWWGHRIPIWSGIIVDYTDEFNALTSSINQLAEANRIAFAIGSDPEDPEDPEQPVDQDGYLDGGNFASFCVRDPSDTEAIVLLENAGFVQDPDVLATWFSSALCPLSTTGWPDASAAASGTGIEDFTKLLSAFNPSSTLTTAREIIT
ncbi:MAG: class I tRNA ligase family protein, partial [Phycisphaerales bacterium]